MTILTEPQLELVEALESGKWKQGHSVLANLNTGEFCCLGVAQELMHAKGLLSIRDVIRGRVFCREYYDPNNIHDASTHVLTQRAMDYYQTSTPNLEISKCAEYGSELNDDGMSFTEIASIIRENGLK